MRHHKAACSDRLNHAPGPCGCGAVEWGETVRRAREQGPQVPTRVACEFFEALVAADGGGDGAGVPHGLPSGMNTGVNVSPELLMAEAGALGQCVAHAAAGEVAMVVRRVHVPEGERLAAQLTAIRWDEGRHQVRVLTAFCRVPS